MCEKLNKIRKIACMLLVLLFASAVGCTTDEVVSGNNSLLGNSTVNNDVNSDDGNSNDANSNDDYNDNQADDTSSDSTISQGAVKKSNFSFELVQYHPGVPGYDVEYQYVLKFKNMPISADTVTVSSNIEGVIAKDGKIIVPKDVNAKGGTLVLTAVYNKDKRYKQKISFQLKAWEKTWADEFDSDRSNWSNYYMSASCLDKNAYVEDGCLKLDVLKEDYVASNGTPQTTSRGYVSTQGKFYQTYGCFTARMKPTKSSYTNGGTMSSFWLMPQGNYKTDFFFKRSDRTDFWGCSEIDILEGYKMITGGSQHTEHWWKEDGTYQGQTPKFSSNEIYKSPEEWHEFSFVWMKYGIYYYVDGKLVTWNTDIEPVANPAPAYIVFGTGVTPPGQSGWTGSLDSWDELPQTSTIDWVRVYK